MSLSCVQCRNVNMKPLINRREFLQTTALATAGLPVVGRSVDLPSSAKGKLKVGCLSWCFHDFSPGVDSEPAIDIIGELGFDGIELIVTAQKDLKDFWSDTRIERY